jgi:hypothetical protein
MHISLKVIALLGEVALPSSFLTKDAKPSQESLSRPEAASSFDRQTTIGCSSEVAITEPRGFHIMFHRFPSFVSAFVNLRHEAKQTMRRIDNSLHQGISGLSRTVIREPKHVVEYEYRSRKEGGVISFIDVRKGILEKVSRYGLSKPQQL